MNLVLLVQRSEDPCDPAFEVLVDAGTLTEREIRGRVRDYETAKQAAGGGYFADDRPLPPRYLDRRDSAPVSEEVVRSQELRDDKYKTFYESPVWLEALKARQVGHLIAASKFKDAYGETVIDYLVKQGCSRVPYETVYL